MRALIFPPPTRFSENRHVRRISAEIADIVTNPFQCLNQIQLPWISHRIFLAQTTQVGAAENVQPVIDADQYDILFAHMPVAKYRQEG